MFCNPFPYQCRSYHRETTAQVLGRQAVYGCGRLMDMLTSFFQESTEEAKQWLCYARDQRAQKWQNCRRNCTSSVSIQVPSMGDLAQPLRRLCSPFSKVPGC